MEAAYKYMATADGVVLVFETLPDEDACLEVRIVPRLGVGLFLGIEHYALVTDDLYELLCEARTVYVAMSKRGDYRVSLLARKEFDRLLLGKMLAFAEMVLGEASQHHQLWLS